MNSPLLRLLLNLAVENAEAISAVIEFESPADSIYGFEHEAKSQKDKDALAAGIKKLEDSIGSMIKFDAKLNCKITTTKMEPAFRDAGEKHSEVRAQFAATCTAPLAGTKVTFGFTSIFPGISRLEVQALSGSKQSSAIVKKDVGAVDL